MVDNAVPIKTRALLVKQRPTDYAGDTSFLKEYDFFVFSLSSSKLLKLAKFTSRAESNLGIQRVHKEERDMQIGQFISSDHPFFPNTIIINVPLEFKSRYYDDKSGILDIAVGLNTAYIIDGQHRLRAFASKYSKGTSLKMVVAAYFGLELPTVAEIFTRINYYQKPVSKSLVYDLLDLNKDPEFTKYKEGHEIVMDLNNNKFNGPLFGVVKMLGIGPGMISQAAFVEAITTRYKIIGLLGSKYDTNDKATIINSYFSSVRESFGSRWANPNSILTKSVGFNALIKILMNIIINNIGKANILQINFSKYTDAMKSVDLDSQEIKYFGGFTGVNALANMFTKALEARGIK